MATRRHDWIADRLKELDKTQVGLAEALGLSKPRISELIGGRRQVKAPEVPVIARFLDLREQDVVARLAGDEAPPAPDKPAAHEFVPVGLQTVMVRGEVEAGVWREAYEWPEDEWQSITVPTGGPYDPKDLFALRVRGPSMDRFYPEGSVLVCVPLWRVGRQPRNGEHVVVERHDATGKVEATVKELEIKPDGKLLLWPRSSHPSPRYQTPIELPSDGLPWGLQDGPATYVHDGLAEQVSEVRVTALVVGGFRWNL